MDIPGFKYYGFKQSHGILLTEIYGTIEVTNLVFQNQQGVTLANDLGYDLALLTDAANSEQGMRTGLFVLEGSLIIGMSIQTMQITSCTGFEYESGNEWLGTPFFLQLSRD